MKNSFKLGLLALVVAVSFAACKGKGAAGSSDSDTSMKKADTSKMAPMDTTKKDTAKMDTSKMKMSKDTAKKKM